MTNALNSGVSGLQQFQDRMDVIGNNIANVNTTGYKAARMNFADAFSQTLQATGANTMQIGTGVAAGSISSLYTQGSLTQTGSPTDLAINGAGFFMVRDAASGDEYATRAGDFKLDSSGYLVTNLGHRVQGFSDAALATRGDIQINTVGAPATVPADAKISAVKIGADGRITVAVTSGTTTAEFVRGQVLTQDFSNPQALVKEGNNLYSGLTTAGALGLDVPSTNGLGTLQAGKLELSNVDLTEEFASLITTQRAFQASARIVTTSDEILQEVVNLKR